jgi:hypothetical protein
VARWWRAGACWWTVVAERPCLSHENFGHSMTENFSGERLANSERLANMRLVALLVAHWWLGSAGLPCGGALVGCGGWLHHHRTDDPPLHGVCVWLRWLCVWLRLAWDLLRVTLLLSRGGPHRGRSRSAA